MAEYTLTYSPKNDGWTSFWSFIPEWIQGMNSRLYTFDGGNLHVHGTNTTRNNFYGSQYTTKISGVFNDDLYNIKHFKTLSLESKQGWDSTLNTDLDEGFIDADWYSKREGEMYAFIRRASADLSLDQRNTLGVGAIKSVALVAGTVYNYVVDFLYGSSIHEGDTLYTLVGSTLTNVGVVETVTKSATQTTFRVDTAGASVASPAEYLMCIKDSVAESYGHKGYYMAYELENDSTTEVELFSIGSEVFKSNP